MDILWVFIIVLAEYLIISIWYVAIGWQWRSIIHAIKAQLLAVVLVMVCVSPNLQIESTGWQQLNLALCSLNLAEASSSMMARDMLAQIYAASAVTALHTLPELLNFIAVRLLCALTYNCLVIIISTIITISSNSIK